MLPNTKMMTNSIKKVKESQLEENQATFRIPKGKSGYIYGPDHSNLKRIIYNSGAYIEINGRRNQSCQAIITGTPEQRNRAIELLNETLGRSNSYSPIMGFTLLDESDNNFGLNLLFKKVSNDEGYKNNVFPNLITYHKYTLEMKTTLSTIPAPRYNNLSINSLSGKIYSFNTISQLKLCLNEIVKNFSNNNRKLLLQQQQQQLLRNQQILLDNSDNEFRLKINFGRELFTKIDKPILTLSEWNKLKRGHNGITTAFCHDLGFFENRKIEKLKRIFNFKEINIKNNKIVDKEDCFITVLYMEKDKKNKFKLQWNANEGCWKIIKSTKNIRRQAIIDIVSGRNESPDLRFLLKSQNRSSSINEKYHKIIHNLQKSEKFLQRNKESFFNDNGKKMFFESEDFNGKFKCTSVRQSIIKRQLTNDKYQMNFISTLQDEGGRITLEDTVNLINLSWISSPPNGCESITTMDPNDPKFTNSITETIHEARKISRIIGDIQ